MADIRLTEAKVLAALNVVLYAGQAGFNIALLVRGDVNFDRFIILISARDKPVANHAKRDEVVGHPALGGIAGVRMGIRRLIDHFEESGVEPKLIAAVANGAAEITLVQKRAAASA